MPEFSSRLGPVLITGAADDNPIGIAPYSQAGSQFRFGLVWTLLPSSAWPYDPQTGKPRIDHICVDQNSLNAISKPPN